MREFRLRDSVVVRAPLERCFLLSTSLAIVQRELGMHPVAGRDPGTGERYRTSGLVRGGDRVRWAGWQLGMPQYHVSVISAYERGRFFQDTMVAGRFRSFQHDHAFEEGAGGVTLRDELRFSMPLGWVGWSAGRMVMTPHIRGLMRRRFALLKRIAEGEDWREYLA